VEPLEVKRLESPSENLQKLRLQESGTGSESYSFIVLVHDETVGCIFHV
jgi:hypothetical protein